MSEDLRCCGTGTCIINAEGECWCGQRWDGERMCFPKPLTQEKSSSDENRVNIAQALDKPD